MGKETASLHRRRLLDKQFYRIKNKATQVIFEGNKALTAEDDQKVLLLFFPYVKLSLAISKKKHKK